MSKGMNRGTQRGPELLRAIVKRESLVKVAAADLVITDGAPGFGTVVIAALPQGNILLHGLVFYATLSIGDADIVDDWDGDFSLGTAATADGTLSGGEIDLIASTAIVQGVSGVSSGNKGVSTTTEHGSIIDNTDGSLEVNFNIIVDDADISDDSSIKVDGTLHMVFSVLGDD